MFETIVKDVISGSEKIITVALKTISLIALAEAVPQTIPSCDDHHLRKLDHPRLL